MSSLKFEGDLEDLSDKQRQYIRDVLEKRGYVDNKVVFGPVGKVGDNMAANVKRVIVEVEKGENFSMIAKIAPTAETMRSVMNIAQVFKNEAIMYTEIFPKFRKLQRIASVQQDELLRYPECYGCNTEAPDEVILLEDLNTLNFFMLDRFQSLPDEAVKIILKNFAILHSLSYVLKKTEPDTYNNFGSKLLDVWNASVDAPEFSTYISQIELDILELFENEDDKTYINAIRGACTASTKLSKTLTAQDADSQHSVIQQGDAWTNNMMFRSENDQFKECIMIDYQMAKKSNPVCDILHMIFNCTDHKTRAEHFYDWLDYYHKHLDMSLHNFGMKASLVYPKYQLNDDIKRYSKVFFGSALVVFSFHIRKKDEAEVLMDTLMLTDPTIAKSKVSILSFSSETTDLYKSKVRQLVDSCREFGFI